MDKREEMIRLVEEFNMSCLTQKDFSATKGPSIQLQEPKTQKGKYKH